MKTKEQQRLIVRGLFCLSITEKECEMIFEMLNDFTFEHQMILFQGLSVKGFTEQVEERLSRYSLTQQTMYRRMVAQGKY